MKKLLLMVLSMILLLTGCAGAKTQPAENPTPADDATPVPGPATDSPPPETPENTPAPPTPHINPAEFALFKDPSELDDYPGLPDVFTMLSGSKVENEQDYQNRIQEIRNLFQYYMYGFWPDKSKETVTYDYNGYDLVITVEAGDNKSSYNAVVSVPDGNAPEGGFPVIIALSFSWGDFPFGHSIPFGYALDNGYAVISYNVPMIASDDNNRNGAFYELYPYNKENIFEQTGTLMAWGWGGSKIIDALENGLGDETGISAENIVLTGVSRYGKAAFVAGAFDERIKATMPACSGTGGASLYRYDPQGNIYDYSSMGGPEQKTTGNPERLDNVQNGFPWWFNSNLRLFKRSQQLPIDQHMLSVLCSTNDRLLFIISETDNDWIGPASTYATFAPALDIFKEIDAENRIAINLHWTGHAVLQEDLEKALPFFDYHFYGKPLPFDLTETLQTTVYDLEINIMDDLLELLGR